MQIEDDVKQLFIREAFGKTKCLFGRYTKLAIRCHTTS
jgi:hypothetical protein